MLLAVSPQLVGVQPNADDLLADGDVRHVAPGELTFRFDEGQVIDGETLGAIRITRAGLDGAFGDARDVMIEPGFAGVNPNAPNEVVVRFQETLPDDLYRIDILGSGDEPLKNIEGDAFNNGVDVRIDFELDLGAQVIAVVPQPIERAGTNLTQARREIVVYFNDDDLFDRAVSTGDPGAPTVVNPEFYRLIFTNETVTNTDDVVHNPIRVDYDPAADTAVLTFADDLEALSGAGTYRLRIGNAEPLPLAPERMTAASDPLVDPLPGPEVDRGTLIDNDLPVGAPGQLAIDIAAGGSATRTSVTLRGDQSLLIGQDILSELIHYVDVGADGGAVALKDTFVTLPPTLVEPDVVVSEGSFAGNGFQTVSWHVESRIESGTSTVVNTITLSSSGPLGPLRLISYVDQGVGFASDDEFVQAAGVPGTPGFRAAMLDASERVGFLQGGIYEPGAGLESASFDGWAADSYRNLQQAIVGSGAQYSPAGEINTLRLPPTDDPELGTLYGPADVTTAFAWSVDPLASSATITTLLDLSPEPATDLAAPGSSFGTAAPITLVDGGSLIISSQIDPQQFLLDFPGSSAEPGHREGVPGPVHLLAGADDNPAITTVPFNFRDDYGRDTDGNVLLNVITDAQKQRAREVFEILGEKLGVQFYETAKEGFVIATGDLAALGGVSQAGGQRALNGLTEPGLPGDKDQFSPAAILDNAESWDDGPGGDWFQTAMQQVLQLLGMGESSDLPPLQIGGDDPALAFGNRPEPIFPGDHDIVHGQFLHRPDSQDIDLYRFEVTQAGLLTAETIAERLPDSSLLDTTLSLFRDTGGPEPELLARNDDYFSEDSLLRIPLGPGTYYIGVTASGNTAFDPTVEGTGIGGTTDGPYDLQLNFRPDILDGIVDATGTLLDGNANGVPGGVYDFWFRAVPASQTLIVDKTNTSPLPGPQGTIDNPFDQLDRAFAAAEPGDVVRVVGNGGADGSLATLDDNLAYEIGFGDFGPLADGGRAQVPQGVTLMIDGGAVFKLLRSAIEVGSSSVSLDRSGAALQVLGTPEANVVFTSYNDESIGVDTNPLPTTPDAGDWGGLFFRNDLDRGEGRFDSEQEGLFLNYVNHADLRYGGGKITIGSRQQTIDPVHMVDARPTITFNSITLSADAAISANPDSFEETFFTAPDSLGIDYQATPFTPDYSRVGPEIHGNRIVGNTTNGLFVRTSTRAGQQLETLTVSGRWDDADIVHVLSENLIISGTPGGPLKDPETQLRAARTDAQLSVDPGVIVKLEGARIEATMGTQVLAEGVAGRQVVFTSLKDARYGAGGTFVTKGDAESAAPAAGDWGGIYAGSGANLSLDHAVLAYGGGVVRVEGSFAGFNVVELQSANGRITNSLFEHNANGMGGQTDPDRAGRFSNAEGAIFVRGSQPIIVNNVVENTAGPRGAAININVNALNHRVVTDGGRSTGPADQIVDFRGNQGPLIRDNRLAGNRINGMIVRGATLTTESVWDDTDIVHVLFDEIVIPNFHTFGGLRLESSATGSLVVKLSGATAGFHVTGQPDDISDRIGGMLHVVGKPGLPVILTSLADDTVGAGFDPLGRPQNDTDGGGRPLPVQEPGSFQIDLNFSPAAAAKPKVVAAAEMAARMWERLFEDPITVTIDVDLADLLDGVLVDVEPDRVEVGYDQVRQALADDARAHESFVADLPAFDDLNIALPDVPSNPFVVDTRMSITRANALALGFELPGTPSDFDPDETRSALITLATDPVLLTTAESPLLFDYDRTDLVQPGRYDATGVMLRAIGTALGFTSAVDGIDAGLADPTLPRTVQLNTLDLFRLEPGAGREDGFTDATRALDPALTQVFFDGGSFDPSRLDIPGLELGDIPLSTGLQFGDGERAAAWKDDAQLGSYLGIMDPRFRTSFERPITEADRQAFDLIGYDVVGGGVAGDWRGITIEQYAHDRNVAAVTESESKDVSGGGTNATPDAAEPLGSLAPDEKAGDEVLRLGFVVAGELNTPADVDVYSFQATPGTEVWLDIDRTTSSLDTVVELIDGEGTVMARSDNSLDEGLGLTPVFAAPGIEANVLQKSVFRATDYWSTNPRDAGFRVVLPGNSEQAETYHVRVRSAGQDIQDLSGGLTAGQYQLQVRLRDIDELPGTSIEFADIRYATDGIRVRGGPSHSPLLGETREDASENDRLPVATFPAWRFFSSLRGPEGENQGEDGADLQGWQYRNLLRSNFPADDRPFESAFNDPQRIGSVLKSNRGAISLGGTLDSAFDTDWYWFEVDQPASLIFDVDYADGLGRADTALAIYDPIFGSGVITSSSSDPTVVGGGIGDPVLSGPTPGVIVSPIPKFEDVESGEFLVFSDDGRPTSQDISEIIGARLLYTSGDSFEPDDRAAPFAGANLDDLSRGTLGSGDPLLGPVFLAPGTYLMAVTSAASSPVSLDQFRLAVAQSDFAGRELENSGGYFPAGDFGSQLGEPFPRNPNNPFIRLEPIDTIARVVEDNIGEGDSVVLSADSAVPYNLGDVVLFVTAGDVISTVDPFTGTQETTVGGLGRFDENGNPLAFNGQIGDFAFRSDGSLYAFSRGLTDAESGNYLKINPNTAVVTGTLPDGGIGDDMIETYEPDPDADPPAEIRSNGDQGYGIQFDAIAFPPPEIVDAEVGEIVFAAGFRATDNLGLIENILYMLDADTGEATSGAGFPDRQGDEIIANPASAFTQKVERGVLSTIHEGADPRRAVILAPDATDGTQRLLTDGMTFLITNAFNRATTFELNSGPEVTFRVDPEAGVFVRDGDTFTVDGTSYEFDTGAVLVVTALDGSQVQDGATFTITDAQRGPVTRTFEFDDGSGDPVDQDRIAVPFSATMDQQELVAAVAAAINGVGGFHVQAAPLGNRITLTGDSTTTDPTAEAGTGLVVEGGVGGLGTLIHVEETDNGARFLAALLDVIDTADTAGNRISFPGANTGDFSEIESRGVFVDQGADGSVAGGNIAIDLLVSDTAESIAAKMADAINSRDSGTARAIGVTVELLRRSEVTLADNPLVVAGEAPGGAIRGMTFVEDRLYAVTDTGGLFQITNYLSNLADIKYIKSSAPLLGISFTSLTTAPPNLEGGRFEGLMFGLDSRGDLYAFDENGQLQDVFVGGKSSISTGVRNSQGIAFSTLDRNLWHESGRRGTDPGHKGGLSFYFGDETKFRTVDEDPNDAIPPVDVPSPLDQPGGALGSLITDPFDLSGYTPEDQPVMYFSYFLASDQVDNPLDPGELPRFPGDQNVDTFRVFVSDESSQGSGEWVLVASSKPSDGVVPLWDNSFEDIPAHPETDTGRLLRNGRRDPFTEELADLGVPSEEEGIWRQARIPLDQFAGSSNLRIRFDFSTAGSMDLGNPATVGSELKAIPAADLRDGQTFIVGPPVGPAAIFEFDTGTTIVAANGAAVQDGELLIVDDGRVQPVTFEFDRDGAIEANRVAIPIAGDETAEEIAQLVASALDASELFHRFTVIVPDGPDIADGDRLILEDDAGTRVTFEFDADFFVGTPGAIPVRTVEIVDEQIVPLDAPEIAASLQEAIETSGLADVDVTLRGLRDNQLIIEGVQATQLGTSLFVIGSIHQQGIRINLEGDTAVSLGEAPGFDAPALAVEGRPGAEDGVRVPVPAYLSAEQVADEIIVAMADALAGGKRETIKRFQNIVRTAGYVVVNAGPLGLADALAGDDSGAFFSVERGLQNILTRYDFTGLENGPDEGDSFDVPLEGVFVDDLIVGFASHGEQVIDMRPQTESRKFFLPEDVDFRFVPADGTLDGAYQVEIRTASALAPRALDPRDRLAQTITLFAPNGAQIRDGQALVLDDGLDQVTLEYEDLGIGDGVGEGNLPVPFRVTDTAAEVATQLRAVINSNLVRQSIDVTAAAPDGTTVGPSVSRRVNLFGNVRVLEPTPGDGTPEGVVQTDLEGSRNRERDQGQLIIANNQIRHSGMYGIVVETPPRDLPTYLYEPRQPHAQFARGDYVPHPGVARNLEELNEANLAAGVTITNNVIAYGAEGGIHFRGDPNGFVIIPPLAGDYNADSPVSEVWNDGGPPQLPAPFVFSITDYQGLTVRFEFDTGDGVQPGNVPILFANNGACPNIVPGGCMPRFSWSGPDMTDLMMTTIAQTDLDINIYRGRADELYLAGAADIRSISPGPNPPFDWFDPWNFPVQPAAVPFGRVVNNTLVGNGGTLTRRIVDGPTGEPEEIIDFTDVGILVEDNAAPTLLNNVVVNYLTGVAADDSAQDTVLGANLFQGNDSNLRNLSRGDFEIELGETAPLFVDFDNGNFYLASGSAAIDSSIDSLEERPELAVVKQPLGIALSPLLAPNRDTLGQLRIDDPLVEPPDGLGENVFKDRGAIDRADFSGPTAQLIKPRDNDAAGNDLDPRENVVQLGNATLTQFSLQLLDGLGQSGIADGSGIDPNTVSGSSVSLSRVSNTSPEIVDLVEGVDYSFSFDATNNLIRLTPLAGVWATGNTYFIRLDNSAQTGLKDIAGNPMRPNTPAGETRFIVGLGNLEDFGDAPDPSFPTLVASNGARHTIVDGFFLGQTVDAELDGQPTPNADGDVPDEDGVTFDSFLLVGAEATFTVVASAPGQLDAWIDLNGDGDWEDDGEQIFASQPLSGGTNILRTLIPDSAVQGVTFARFRFSSEGGLAPTGPAPDGEVEDYKLVLGTNPWQNSPDPLNVDNDPAGIISPLDALVIINELNDPAYSDATTGELPVPPPVPPAASDGPPFFYDVNGDGFATPLDALIVINFLNAQASAAGTAAVAAEVGGGLVDTGLSLHPATGQVAEPSTPIEQTPVPAGDAHTEPTPETRLEERVRPVEHETDDDPWHAHRTERDDAEPERWDIDAVLSDIAADVLEGWHEEES